MRVITVLVLALVISITSPARSAQTITMPQTFTEDFNSFVGTAASIPPNFTWSNSFSMTQDFSPGGNYDASGSYGNSNSTFALSFGPTSMDYAYGTKPPTFDHFLDWDFTNNTGGPIPSFSVSWDVEQYSEAGRATEIDFSHNPNSTGFTQSGIAGTTLTTATTTSGTASNLSSVGTTSRSVTVNLTTPLADGQSISFRWSILSGSLAGAGGANAHIGVDNLSVTPVPEPSSFLIIAIIGTCLSGLGYLKRHSRSDSSPLSLR